MTDDDLRAIKNATIKDRLAFPSLTVSLLVMSVLIVSVILSEFVLPSIPIDAETFFVIYVIMEILRISVCLIIFSARWVTRRFGMDTQSYLIGLIFLSIAIFYTFRLLTNLTRPTLSLVESTASVYYLRTIARATIAFALLFIAFIPYNRAISTRAVRASLVLLVVYVSTVGALVYLLGDNSTQSSTSIADSEKIALSACMIIAFLAAGYQYNRIGRAYNDPTFLILSMAMFLSIAADIAYLLFSSTNDAQKVIGDVVRFCTFIILYIALVQTAFRKPFELLEGAKKQAEVSISDLTKRKRAEERLDLSMQAGEIGAWELNLKNGTAWRSLRHDQIFGYEALLPEWTQETFYKHVVQEDLPQVKEKFQKAMSTASDWDFECRIKRRDGVERWIKAHGKPKRNETNEPELMFGVVEDITGRKQLEESLLEANKNADERMRELMAFYHLAETITKDNITLEEVYQELVGVLPESWQYPEVTCARIVFGGEEFRTKNYRESAWKQSASIKVNKVARGTIEICYLEERPEEDEGPFLKEERLLIDAIAERVGRVTERRLAEHRLTESNKELDAFSYSVSHDLRAPLRSMDGFSKVLLEDHADRIDDVGKDYLKRIRAASQLMGQLIDDLLKLSRISRSEMRVETVDLSELGREIAAQLRNSSPGRNVEFVIADGLVARGDPHLLKIAIDNLMGNAWKFTSRHPAARIEFGQDQTDGKKAFFVRDDGAGFDMAYVGKMFAPFQRLHSSDEFPGTGVGLVTVKRIIDRHGGMIWAEGAVEKGATFHFTMDNRGSNRRSHISGDEGGERNGE
jgi:PAS domain S-box-containing protein